MTSTEFSVTGVPPNTPLTFRARLAVEGTLDLWLASYSNAPGFAMRMFADADHSQIADRVWLEPSRVISDTLYNVRDTVEFTLTLTSSRTFRMTTTYMTSGPSIGALDLTAQWLFDGLPAGARVTSCAGFGGGPVPTGLALASADAYLDHVDLAWVGGDVSTSFTVERSDADGVASWSPLATVLADGSGRIAYRDGSVAAGAAYRYRLRGSNGSTAPEADVHIPATARLTLAISGAQPVHGPIQFAVTRPGSAAAKLELYDVAGRLVQSHVFAAGGAPSEKVALDPAQGSAGIFMARLTCGRESRTVRVVRVP
jgi:hypothetical protein